MSAINTLNKSELLTLQHLAQGYSSYEDSVIPTLVQKLVTNITQNNPPSKDLISLTIALCSPNGNMGKTANKVSTLMHSEIAKKNPEEIQRFVNILKKQVTDAYGPILEFASDSDDHTDSSTKLSAPKCTLIRDQVVEQIKNILKKIPDTKENETKRINLKQTLVALEFTNTEYTELKSLVDNHTINSRTVELTKKLLDYVDLPKDKTLDSNNPEQITNLAKDVRTLSTQGSNWTYVNKLLSAVWNLLKFKSGTSSPHQLLQELHAHEGQITTLLDELEKTSKESTHATKLQIIKQLTLIRDDIVNRNPTDCILIQKIETLTKTITAQAFLEFDARLFEKISLHTFSLDDLKSLTEQLKTKLCIDTHGNLSSSHSFSKEELTKALSLRQIIWHELNARAKANPEAIFEFKEIQKKNTDTVMKLFEINKALKAAITKMSDK